MIVDGWVVRKKTLKKYTTTSAGLRESFDLMVEGNEYSVNCHTNLKNPKYIWAFFGSKSTGSYVYEYLADCNRRSGLEFRIPTKDEILSCNNSRFFRYITGDIDDDSDNVYNEIWHVDKGSIVVPTERYMTFFVYEGGI